MTKHPRFPTATANENVVDFPDTRNTSLVDSFARSDDHLPAGIPEGFTLHDDGVYQLRPHDGDDLVPVKICSPLIVKGRCRRPDGTGWGFVIALQDHDGVWHELVLEASVVSGGPATVVRPLLDRGLLLTNELGGAERQRVACRLAAGDALRAG